MITKQKSAPEGVRFFCVKVLGRLLQKAVESKGEAVGRPPQRAKSPDQRKIRRGRQEAPVERSAEGEPYQGVPLFAGLNRSDSPWQRQAPVV